MNCLSCGAAAELVGSRGYFHCQHCGRYHFPEPTAEGVCVLGDPAETDCPVCSIGLQTALIEGRPVSYCAGCRGFLATMADFGAIVRQRRAKQSSPVREREPFDPKELQRGVLCPRCQRTMDVHPYGGGGNAVIDSCHRCHLVWLDARELAIIERYVPHVHKIEPAACPSPAPSAAPPSAPWEDPGLEAWWPF